MSENTPEDRFVTFIARAERLEALPRTGWLVCGVTDPESIASHAYMVTLTALWIADQIPQAVDTERLLRIALVHDMPEALLTDLPAPVKRFVGADHVAAAERRAAASLLQDTHERWLDAYDAYEARDTLEARIVKGADRIQMLAKALQYRAQHRGDVTRFFDKPYHFDDFGVPLVGAILARLERHWREQTWPQASFD